MGISGISAIGSASGGQMMSAQSVDTVSKSIQDEISEVQRQKQSLSSNKDMPVEEKTKKRQELQQEISSLNAKLRQHQAEVRKEKQKELMKDNAQTGRTDTGSEERRADEKKASAVKAAEGRETETKDTDTKDNAGRDSQAKAVQAQSGSQKEVAANNAAGSKSQSVDDRSVTSRDTGVKEAKDNNTDDQELGISAAQMQGMVAADSQMKNMGVQDRVIARIEGGVAILKGEIRQDENRGADTAPKRAELEKQEQRTRWAAATSFADLGVSSNTEKQAKADSVTGVNRANAMWDNPAKIVIRDTDYL